MKRRSQKTGLSPGTLLHIGAPSTAPVEITLIRYDAEHYTERSVSAFEECGAGIGKGMIAWIHVDGVHDVRLMEEIGKALNLHPLVMEDVVNTDQRPKCEDYGDYLFLTAKRLQDPDGMDHPGVEQVSLIVTPTCVVSFLEKKSHLLDPIRDRLRNSRGRIRGLGTDYLAYALLDAIVDNTFLVLEKEGDRIERLETRLAGYPDESVLQELHRSKRRLILIRKACWPLREAIATLQRSESALITESSRLYLRDVHDHCVQIMDIVETYRDMISGMVELYMSSLGNRANQIMKVLTLIATIFIPLTFIAGVYGMNFKNMPELESRLGYPLALAAMAMVGAGMLLFFRRRKWL
jgi:magnesium transporter